MKDQLNLCGRCNRDIPSCPEVSPIFGSDNVVSCKTYDRDHFLEKMEQLRELIKTQCSDGNWNYDPYMHGMANGMILSEHVASGAEGDVAYLDAPDHWLKEENIPNAVEILRRALLKDPEFAYVWRVNIAASMFDAIPEKEKLGGVDWHKIANEGASRFMKLRFGVETSQDMALKKESDDAGK